MELAFIWVERFRTLENIGFNFANDVKFIYDPERFTLSQEVNDDIYIPNFFGEAVTNLSAVIGQNGVGKSTLFLMIRVVSDDVKLAFADDKAGSGNSNVSYVAVFRIGDLFYYFKNKIGGKIKCSFAELNKRQKIHVDNYQCFYYANFFDYSNTHTFKHIFDVSTTALVGQTYAEIRYKTIEREEHIYETDFLFNYKTKEIISQIEFVASFDKHIPFKLPSTLVINLVLEDRPPEDDEIDNEDEPMEEQDKKYYEAVQIIEKIKRKYNKVLAENYSVDELKGYIKTTLQQAVLVNFLKDNVFHQTNVVGHYELNFDITQHYSLPRLAAIKNLDKLFVDIVDLIAVGDDEYSGEELLKWINDLIELIDVKKHYDVDRDVIYIKLNEISNSKFFSLMSSYSEMRFRSNFLDFYWDGISSGENALVTIFSRFYSYRKAFKQPNPSIMLMFDECEINFHPAWQRKLIHLLTTIFPIIFRDSKLQFFISSHSPLILSDIPKSNIIFLRKAQDGRISISHLTDKKQTFAANIHTLLSDAFFMDEGTIGEVAKNKINWVIDYLSRRYVDFEEQLPTIERLVEIIGEPVIKSKLTSMINEKHSLNFFNINERIKLLEKNRKL